MGLGDEALDADLTSAGQAEAVFLLLLEPGQGFADLIEALLIEGSNSQDRFGRLHVQGELGAVGWDAPRFDLAAIAPADGQFFKR